MVDISTGSTECFSGAYKKRLEQTKYEAIANAKAKLAAENESSDNGSAEVKTRQTAQEYLGTTVTISEESKNFMAGIADRKAAQREAKLAASQESAGNAFSGTGDLRQQYLVFSENLYNNGFYNDMSDDEVKDTEDLLRQITSGMDSINSLTTLAEEEMSHEAAKLELSSSVNALNYFAETRVAEDIRDSFKELVKQYESYNSSKVAVHKNIFDLRDESMSKIEEPNAVYVSDMVKKTQEATKASQEIGKVTHTQEQENANRQEIQSLFEKLMKKEADVSSVFESLQNTLVSYASGGSKNSSVISLLQSRNSSAISNMAEYWKKLV